MKYPKKPELTLAQHAAGLRAMYPHAEIRTVSGVLTWRDTIQPMALAWRYVVELKYRLGEEPTIRILEPNLRELAGGRLIEHLYSQEEQVLCVYYPDGREWNAGKSLANTVVLWAHEWIVHFEAWLFTGVWDGGGTHPEPRNRKPEPEIATLTSAPLL
jgi:hypothetical protein